MVRPTSARVREAVFSIIGSRVKGSFLDAFGGSGIMGIEAASRGAEEVLICEILGPVYRQIQSTIKGISLPISVSKLDARMLLHQRNFDVVFLDPPYKYNPSDWLPFGSKMATDLLVYEHSPTFVLPNAFPGWERDRLRVYGDCAISVYNSVG